MPEGKKSNSAAAGSNMAYGWDARAVSGLSQHALEHWAHGVSALTDEVTHFVQARMQEDMSAWAKLANCRNPNEIFACQRHFTEKAASDYFDEAGKLSHLVVRIASEGFSSLRAEGATGSASKEARAA